ncbi:hypothetical protein TBLA_0J01100 [Henningerozyma blattae CBS 6284]|uniref:Autophagy-related protein 27 n=1 Tax=Henningerozyma blattae (strain ATCC 34711 / CBS 6284 / DSM 70876 / NBRC 10599 / NRRL Y-10934 / UCD 77-7) TaxID=1071380 RepID=I2H9Q6_HENB6|nr:hypothetical protein TBLA_0J01100 [Tetrapisispora blattae CBS 6284]CCH63108.1 hypothetical protein TBLA_0J01100 [Tetrapisispora blattae CBS 6284]
MVSRNLLLSLFASTAFALDCSSHELLSKFRISNSKSLIEKTSVWQTPPSLTFENWFIDICQTSNNTRCNDDDYLCSTTEVQVQTPASQESKLLTQMIHFNDKLDTDVDIFQHHNEKGFQFVLYNNVWGDKTFDTKLLYHCSKNKETDELVFFRWLHDQLIIKIDGPSGCLIDENDSLFDKKCLGWEYFKISMISSMIIMLGLVGLIKYLHSLGYLQQQQQQQQQQDQEQLQLDEEKGLLE